MANSPLKVLVIDDEAPARRKLLRYLSEDRRFLIAGEASNGPDAVEKIQALKPDLLLLDVQMPGMNGFDVLNMLEDPIPAVIFTTAYDKYAVDAFEVSAVDYLLKPISKQRLIEALDKTIAKPDVDLRSMLAQLVQPEYLRQLPVRHLKRVRLLDVTRIAYITSEHRVVHIYDEDGNSFWTGETLEQLNRRLDPNQFFRIHRSSIINLSANFEIEPWDDGRLKIHFANDQSLTVARDPATRLRELLSF